jgi:hypothetical protein
MLSHIKLSPALSSDLFFFFFGGDFIKPAPGFIELLFHYP